MTYHKYPMTESNNKKSFEFINNFEQNISFVIKLFFMNLKCTKSNRIMCHSLSLHLISMRNMRIVSNAIVFQIALRKTSAAYVNVVYDMRCNCSCTGNRDMSHFVAFLVIIAIFVLVLSFDLFVININLL